MRVFTDELAAVRKAARLQGQTIPDFIRGALDLAIRGMQLDAAIAARSEADDFTSPTVGSVGHATEKGIAA